MTSAKSKPPLWPLVFCLAAAAGWVALSLAMKPGKHALPEIPAGVPQLARYFATGADRQRDALQLAAMLDELAAVIEFDGSRSKPELTDSAKLEDFRVLMREFTFGQALGNKYPGLAEEIGGYLDKAAGKENAELSAEARHRWCEAFRGLAISARHAAQ